MVDLRNTETMTISGYDILKNHPMAIMIVNPDTSINYINPAFEKLFGYKSSELIGKKPPYPYWLPGKISETKDLLKKTMKKGVKKFETQLMKKNGRKIWIEADSVPVMKNGRLEYYLLNLNEITLKKETEAKFRKTYSELDTVFKTAEDGMRIIDIDFNVLRVNKKFCSISGLSEKENLKRKCYESFPGDSCKSSSCDLKKVLNGAKRVESEVLKVVPGNKKILCNVIATPLKVEDGKTLGAVLNYKVLSERVKTEKEIRNLAKFLSENPNPVMRIEKGGKVIHANKAGIIQLKKLKLRIGKKAPKIFYEIVVKLFTEKSYKPEIINIDVGKRVFEFVITPVRETGYANLYGRDVTERIKAEKALKASEKKYYNFFESSPIAISIQDYSETKKYLDKLEKKGVKNFRKYFNEHKLKTILNIMKAKFVEINSATVEMFEASSKNYLSKNIRRLITKEAMNFFIEAITAYAEGKTDFSGETSYRTFKGNIINLFIRVTALPGYEKNAKRVLVTNIDITERKNAQEKLQNSRDMYRVLFDNMGEGFAHCKLIFDSKGWPIDWIYLRVNKNFERLTGMKDVAGKKVTKAFPGLLDSNPELLEIYSRVVSSGKPESFEDYIVPLSTWLHISVTSPAKGQFVVIFNDITERKKSEKALIDSEKNYKDIFQSTMVSLSELDFSEPYSMLKDLKASGITDLPKYLAKHPGYAEKVYLKVKSLNANDQALKLFGVRNLAEMKKVKNKIFISNKLEIFNDSLTAIYEGRPYFEAEYIMHNNKGKIIDVSSVWKIPKNIDQAKRVVNCLIDITDRKKIEEQILDLAKFPSENPNPVIRIEKSGKVIYSNQAGVEQLKKLRSKVGRKAPRIFYNMVARLFKEERNKPEIINAAIGEEVCEYILTPVLESGYVNLYGRDITARLKAEEEIKKYSENLEDLIKERTEGLEILNQELVNSEKKYSELFKSNKDGIMFTDMDGYILDANKAYRDMVGYNMEELRKLTYQDLTPEKFQKLNKEIVKNQVLPRGFSEEFEIDHIKKSGMVFPLTVRVWLIKDERGRPAGMWAMIRDLTQIKKLQLDLIKKEKLAVLGQLAGGVGHELRNPLTAIKNASYFLNMSISKKDSEIKETLDILNEEVDVSNKIISNLLDFSRTRQIKTREVNINDIIEKSLKSLSKPANVKIVTRLYKKTSLVMADSGYLMQVFSNIILNAFQAMPEGGKLTIKSRISNNKWAEISISDTGTGIAEENINEVFEPLFTTKAKGIGLGMALARILIDAHGGKIGLESKVGEGTIFTVKLPIKQRK